MALAGAGWRLFWRQSNRLWSCHVKWFKRSTRYVQLSCHPTSSTRSTLSPVDDTEMGLRFHLVSARTFSQLLPGCDPTAEERAHFVAPKFKRNSGMKENEIYSELVNASCTVPCFYAHTDVSMLCSQPLQSLCSIPPTRITCGTWTQGTVKHTRTRRTLSAMPVSTCRIDFRKHSPC